MVENVPNLVRHKFTDSSSSADSKINTKTIIPRHITVKLLKAKIKRKSSKKSEKNDILHTCGEWWKFHWLLMRIYGDLKIVKYFQEAQKNKNCQSRIQLPLCRLFSLESYVAIFFIFMTGSPFCLKASRIFSLDLKSEKMSHPLLIKKFLRKQELIVW